VSGDRVLWHCFAGCTQEAVQAELERRGLYQASKSQNTGQNGARMRKTKTYPDVDAAIAYFAQKNGLPSNAKRYEYRNADNELVGYTVRWDTPDKQDSKVTRPFWKAAAGQWCIGRPDADLPLFGLPRLRAANPETTLVIVVEGEKCACALQEACDKAALHQVIAVTSVGGAKAARCSDWSVMAGRRVLVLPDNDEAGLGYARDVVELCQQAGASEVRVYELHQHATQLPDKGDIADVLADPNFCGLPLGEGASVAELVDWFQQHAEAADTWLSRYADQNGQTDGAAGAEARPERGGRRSQVTKAIELALAEAVLFTCQRTREPFAEVNRGDHKETYPLESGGFTEWLAFRYYQTYGVGLREATAKDACATLRQCAMLNGRKRPVFLRFGYWEGAVYWDLGDPQWRCIRITADGWTVVAHADTPIRFRRTDKMTALPDPERGGTLDELRELLNVPDDQWTVLLASVVCNFLPTGTIPILTLTGPDRKDRASQA
jgi:hypothetical protein